MTRVDLHLHSCHSTVSSEWLIRQIGLPESYTEVEDLYRQAKARGMSFVTITDHDAIGGCLELMAAHPGDTFCSVEVTTRFPESGCKIHLLVYGLDERQFGEIETIRNDIHALRDYVRAERLAHSVAHATYDMDGNLDVAHLEKLILLFDVFETINGSRTRRHNELWREMLGALTPAKIGELRRRHGIEPFGADSWIKGYTGGSDDHAGAFIGTTWTEAAGASPVEFLAAIRERGGQALGTHGNYRKLAYAMYGIGWQHSRRQDAASRAPRSVVEAFNMAIFEPRPLSFRERLQLRRWKNSRDPHERHIAGLLEDILRRFAARSAPSTEENLEWLYDRLSEFVDAQFASALENLRQEFSGGNMVSVAQRIFAMLPLSLLSVPFLTTSRLLFSSNDTVWAARTSLVGERNGAARRVLWFTDTINDLNGVSTTLRMFARQAGLRNLPLSLVVCVPENERGGLPDNTIALDPVCDFGSEIYSDYIARFPSLLRSLRVISEQNPDEILISTPGPVGLLGLLAARVLGVRCQAIYHTDFRVQIEKLIGSGMGPVLAESYCRWFYSQCDVIRVPSRVYVEMLASRNYGRHQMALFPRGLESEAFGYDPAAGCEVRAAAGVPGGFQLLWAGRVSRDKNLDFLLELYRQALSRRPDLNLIIAGDGPDLEIYRRETADLERVRWLGRLDREELRRWYNAADLFVFPSNMDTFGMVVLEAQACGLPALVTDVGGPQEIVREGDNGRVLSLHEPEAWLHEILKRAGEKDHHPARLARRRESLANAMRGEYHLDRALQELLELGAPAAGVPPALRDLAA
jgi:glycosyltransferase involved in cell wall biosynthesis/predicted metal-dependent phosphoesterase TrpH